jgi:hypothetical protein
MVFIVLNVDLFQFKVVECKVILTDIHAINCGNNFSDLLTLLLNTVKIPFGKILYMLVHLKTKSVNQLVKELDLHRNIVGRYHERIREFLVKNHVDPAFNGEIEMDEA